jgi:hypothetical protein
LEFVCLSKLFAILCVFPSCSLTAPTRPTTAPIGPTAPSTPTRASVITRERSDNGDDEQNDDDNQNYSDDVIHFLFFFFFGSSSIFFFSFLARWRKFVCLIKHREIDFFFFFNSLPFGKKLSYVFGFFFFVNRQYRHKKEKCSQSPRTDIVIKTKDPETLTL